MRVFLLSALLVLVFDGLSLVENNRYSTKEYGCSLLAPEGWTLFLSIDGFLAKVESPDKSMSCGVSAQLFKEPVPIERYIASIENSHGLSKKGSDLKKYLKTTLDGLSGEGGSGSRKELESLIADDAPTPEQLEKAKKMAEDRGGISELPEQTMATRIYTLPAVPPDFPTERTVLVYYITRRTVGYYYYFNLPPGGFNEAIPSLKVILQDANLKGLTGGRYALPQSVPEGPPKFGLIHGKVLRSGTSVGGVTVVLYRNEKEYNTGKPYMSTTSAYGGEFMLTNIPPGHYFVLLPVGAGEFKPVYNVTIQEGRAFMANIELMP